MVRSPVNPGEQRQVKLLSVVGTQVELAEHGAESHTFSGGFGQPPASYQSQLTLLPRQGTDRLAMSAGHKATGRRVPFSPSDPASLSRLIVSPFNVRL